MANATYSAKRWLAPLNKGTEREISRRRDNQPIRRYPPRLRDLARLCARIEAMRPRPPHVYRHAVALAAAFRAKQPIWYVDLVAFDHAFVQDGGKLIEPACCPKCAGRRL